jgi:hypothetical protein
MKVDVTRRRFVVFAGALGRAAQAGVAGAPGDDATGFHVAIGDEHGSLRQHGGCFQRRAAWRYDAPSPAFAPIAGWLAFYAGLMEACWVGDMRVTPQPGDFYGGRVTPNLDGAIKGAPGTRHW